MALIYLDDLCGPHCHLYDGTHLARDEWCVPLSWTEQMR